MEGVEQKYADEQVARSTRKVALRVALSYLVIALVWIVASDYLVGFVPAPLRSRLEVVTGSLFVIVTAGLLWLVIMRWARRFVAQANAAAGAALKFERVMRVVPAGIVMTDLTGRIEFLNSRAEQMLHVKNADAVGRDLTDVVTPLESTLFSVDELMRAGCVNGLEMRGTDDGVTTVVVACGSRLESPTGAHQWVIALTDVSDTHREEERTVRLVNGYRFISKALHAVDMAADKGQLLSAVCAAAVDDGVFSAAWVVARNEKTGRLATVASAGLTAEVIADAETLSILLPDDPSFGANAQTPDAELYVVNDLFVSTTDPLGDIARELDFGSSAMLQVGAAGESTFTLTLFAAEVGFFDQEQIRLVHTLREAMSFALGKLELDSKRLDAEESLVRSEEAYRDIFEKHPEPMWVYDRASLRFLAVNDATVRKYGYTPEEFDGMTIIDIRPVEDLPRILNAVAHLASQGSSEDGYWTHIDKQGRAFTVHVHSNSVNWQGAEAQLVLVQEVPVLD